MGLKVARPPFLSAVAAAALAASGAPAAAQPPAQPVSFLVTSTIANADGRLEADELVSLASENGTTLVRLENRDGRTLSAAVRAAGDGTLEVRTSDPALICYNLALRVLADADAHDATPSLGIAFQGDTVSVPLELGDASLADGTRRVAVRGATAVTLNDGQAGTAVSVVVTGVVRAQQGALIDAQLSETSLLAATGAAVARTTCTVVRLPARVPATASTPV